ncbi:hypothetical protein OAP63_13395, partial [Vibrio sp.]|nr:hypothetical protein [Vibrio sp.]
HHICCSGAPADIRKHPNYIAMFGDRSRETLAFYEHHHQHHHDLAGQPVSGEATRSSGRCSNARARRMR